MSLKDAMALVKRRRPEARPIPAFIPMLEGYEKDIQNSTTTTVGQAPKKKRKIEAGPSMIGPALLGPPKKKPSIGASIIGPAMIGPYRGPSTVGPLIGPSIIGPAIGPSIIGPPRRPPVGPSLPPPTSSTTTKDDPSLDSK
jgi:hypothetical protein